MVLPIENYRRFYAFWTKGGETMLNMLLAVIRTIISELVDLLLRRVCAMG